MKTKEDIILNALGIENKYYIRFYEAGPHGRQRKRGVSISQPIHATSIETAITSLIEKFTDGKYLKHGQRYKVWWILYEPPYTFKENKKLIELSIIK